MKIAIGSDHAGFSLKEALKAYLIEKGHEVSDFGTTSPERSDYPDIAFPVARAVAAGKADQGVLVCGTGGGMAIAANKIPGVRAVPCQSEEMARMGRAHNDGNVLALGGRLLSLAQAKHLVDIWLTTPFEGERHLSRLEKIHKYEAE